MLRLMGFHVVRGTKAITFSPSVFLGDPAYRHIREPWHLQSHRDYPDPKYRRSQIECYKLLHSIATNRQVYLERWQGIT